MPEQKKQINLNINDGVEFFAHEMGLNFNPEQFIFDFRSVTPRIDPRSNESPVIMMRHNVVMVTPYHAKRVSEILSDAVKKYEKEFGKIEKPKAVQKYEAKHKKKIDSNKEKAVTVSPSYFG